MSWSRDFFEEVRKIDGSVAAYISTLGFTAAEKMLIGSIILFGVVTNLEAIRSFKYLLRSGGRINDDERFRLFSRLVDPPKTLNISDQGHEDRVKELLKIMFERSASSVSSPNKRVLAVRLILRNLRH